MSLLPSDKTALTPGYGLWPNIILWRDAAAILNLVGVTFNLTPFSTGVTTLRGNKERAAFPACLLLVRPFSILTPGIADEQRDSLIQRGEHLFSTGILQTYAPLYSTNSVWRQRCHLSQRGKRADAVRHRLCGNSGAIKPA